MVNLQPKELENWLKTEESKSVGQDSGDGESIGHKSGKQIIKIKREKKENLTDADYEQMQKVSAYISRHTADFHKPSDNIKESNWRFSLMNWGDDPLQ